MQAWRGDRDVAASVSQPLQCVKLQRRAPRSLLFLISRPNTPFYQGESERRVGLYIFTAAEVRAVRESGEGGCPVSAQVGVGAVVVCHLQVTQQGTWRG